MKLSQVIEELVDEKGLDRSIIGDIICEGLLSAYEKKYPEIPLKVSYNKNSDELDVTAQKKIVQAVDDDLSEISLRKARAIDKDSDIGDSIEVPFEGSIGRIEIDRKSVV